MTSYEYMPFVMVCCADTLLSMIALGNSFAHSYLGLRTTNEM